MHCTPGESKTVNWQNDEKNNKRFCTETNGKWMEMEEVLCYNCLKQKKLRGKKARKGKIMTKKRTLLHAFHNEPVDRVPIAFGIIFHQTMILDRRRLMSI